MTGKNGRKASVQFSDLIEKSHERDTSAAAAGNTENHNEQPQQQHKNNKLFNEMPQRLPKATERQLLPFNKEYLANRLTGSTTFINNTEVALPRRPSALLQEILTTRRPSAIMAALTRPPVNQLMRQRAPTLYEDPQASGSSRSFTGYVVNDTSHNNVLALESRRKNRRIGDDALSTALSALYCKIIVIMGIALPVTEVLSSRIPIQIYQGFYVYLYFGSILFVMFTYMSHCRTRAVFSIIKSYHEKTDSFHVKRRTAHFGSFYLRVGAIAFGIGNMVYSGLEIGLYFELQGKPGCTNLFVVLTPVARMALSIVQMQFIFLNTTELDMARHKVIARFGLMHMVATNLCEWLYVLVEETKHEIFHIAHHAEKKSPSVESTVIKPILNLTQALLRSDNPTENISHDITKRSAGHSAAYIECHRTNIMGSLVQNASPFLFPCTIEYSLICAVILYEMWKKVKSLPDIERSRRNSQKVVQKSAHHFSIDCARAHRGMFAGILVIVLTIIALIMYFVLHDLPDYEALAIAEVTLAEILMYSVCIIALIAAVIKMRDLKYYQSKNDHHASSVNLDNTLLVLAQTGVYLYAMFSIMGCYFAMVDNVPGGQDGLIAESLSLIQTSIQTLFILNASWRRCKGQHQNRQKPGRQIVTFLLVANMSMWFINTLIKGRASFRPTHLEFFGVWAWTVITHVSMPLAIFYRFHSTICLFEIWKTAYKVKADH